jgi:L-rhamnose mutarotase
MLLAEWQHRVQRTRTTSCWKEVVEINAKATIQNYSADFLKVTFLHPSQTFSFWRFSFQIQNLRVVFGHKKTPLPFNNGASFISSCQS